MRTAVISGGTKGIGKALVKEFLSQGFQVFTCGRTAESVQQLKSEFPDARLQVERVDVAQKAALQAWATSILAAITQVDVLVNNAGRFIPGSIGEEEDEAFETMIQTNLASAYHLSRCLLPQFKAQHKGHIFNICSTASIVAYTNGGSYCISKFGLLGFSKVLREELKPFGIKVTSILPGATLTDSWAGSNLPEERFIPAEDLARLIWQAYDLHPTSVVEEMLIRPLLGDIG